MNWITIIWSMVASACLALAVMHLLVWCMNRKMWSNLLFSLSAMATAALAGAELWMMKVQTPAQFSIALRYTSVPVWVTIMALIGFVLVHLRAGRPWLAWTVCALRTFSLLLNFLVGPNLYYRQITGLRHISLLGESVTIAEGVSNPWMLVAHLGALLFLVFLVDAFITVWRRGDGRRALTEAGSLVFFILASLVEAVLVFWHFTDFPLMLSVFYVGFIVVMGYELSIESLRAWQLSKDLQESQLRLNLAAEAAGAGLWSLNIETNIFWLTEKTRELFGFPRDEEISFKRFLDVVYPEYRESVLKALHQAIETKEETFIQYRAVRPDGSIRWMDTRGSIQPGESAGPDLLMGVTVDITERKQIEKQLEEQLQFETLLADLSRGFISSPADQVDREIKDAQRRICEYLGLDLSALWQCVAETPAVYRLTHLYLTLEGPPTPEQMIAHEYFPWCQQQLLAGNVIAVSSMDDLPPQAARDRQVWRHYGVKTSLTLPLSSGGGTVIGFLSFNTMREERLWPEAIINQLQLVAQIFANALARKHTDQNLRESEARLTMTMEAASAGAWSMEIGTNRVWASAQERDLFKFAPDEVLTYESFDRVIHPEDRKKVWTAVDEAIRSKAALLVEYRILLPDGSIRCIVTRGQLHCDTEGNPDRLMGISADITGRKRAEEETRQIREEYTHIARVSMMGELTASLSHELKQPLAAIRSNAQAALRILTGDTPDIDELHEILKDIIIDNRRADEVIKKLRALMRKSELHITALNINDLIEDILPLVASHEAMRKISLSLELDEAVPLVTGDRIQIQQVILNLILNSTEALMDIKKPSRSITVRTHQQDSGTVMLSVSDNGPGIEAKAMPHLFEAFYTTKPEGMGMGLTICRSIVEAHGGRLWAQNNPDGGAAFYFTIPTAREN